MLRVKRKPKPAHLIGLVTDHQVHAHGIESWFVRRHGDVQVVTRYVNGHHTAESRKFVDAFAASRCQFSLAEQMRTVAVREVVELIERGA